jgi:hypothetical protein
MISPAHPLFWSSAVLTAFVLFVILKGVGLWDSGEGGLLRVLQ